MPSILASDYNHPYTTMSHPNANLSPNCYVSYDPEQAFGDHVHVSHDGSPNYTDAIWANLSPQEPLTQVHHPHEYYNQSFHSSSVIEPNPGQAGVVALEHGNHMNPVQECLCISCDSQKLSTPAMSVAMPFPAFQRELSAGILSTGATSLPPGCPMDDLSFHGTQDMAVTFSSLPNSPQVHGLLSPQYELQSGWHHYQHGQGQVGSFNCDTAIHDYSETDTSYQGSSSPGPSECTTESTEEPMSTSGSATGTRHLCLVPDCGQSFPRASSLKTHMGTHSTHRPFSCTLCDHSFARIHDRDRHMNSHLMLKPYACIVCQTRFARQDAVTRHLKMSAMTNICAWLLEAKGLSAKDVAAGRVPRSALGEEGEIQETLERMAEEARVMRMRKTEEMLLKTEEIINGTQSMCNTPSN